MRQLTWKPMVTAAVLTITVALAGATPAWAANYPSWQDLQNAKSNTAAAQKQVDSIRSFIAGLEKQVAAAQNLAAQKQAEYDTAAQKLADATAAADSIQAQADASKAEAATAAKNAGQIISQMYRSSGNDMSVSIFLNSDPSQVDQLLSKLGNLNRVASRANDMYTKATVSAKTAESLSAQAAKAREERGKLEVAANQALTDAQAAQASVESALATQQEKGYELELQLAFMQNEEQATARAYQAGLEERARLAALYSEGGGLPAGWISNQGWAVPAGGALSDGYGPREVICSSGGCSGSFHYGQDIAARCNAPIYSASDGQVIAVGYSGTWGYRVKIDHGGGIYTLYAHMPSDGPIVGVGQIVGAGEQIGRVGMTGAATGCHLHFEVYEGSNRIDPYSFMADRGVQLG
ncbi:MAG: peptidoglycan DD-metalloendopeptidase family protein [Microbacteriaceae bacterium]